MTELPTAPPLGNKVVGIHGNETYINFEYSFFTLPMFLLFVPLFYMPITLLIIIRICVKLSFAVKEKYVNVHLFLAIVLSIFTYLLFFVLDFFHLRLPTTGMFTSWCASVQPNRYINALYSITFYVNYATMLFPFLVSLMRLVLIQYPQRHLKINRTILKIGIPVIFLYPSLFTFFLIPSLGYCTQPGPPYTFGAMMLMFQGSWFGLRNNFFLLGNTMFWMTASVINNVILFVKLITLKSSLSGQMRSHRSHRTEYSLSLTTCSMLLSYVSNGMIVVCAQLLPAYTYTAILLRPFGNDLDCCVVSWVFYLTYPVFRRKSTNKVVILANLKLNV